VLVNKGKTLILVTGGKLVPLPKKKKKAGKSKGSPRAHEREGN